MVTRRNGFQEPMTDDFTFKILLLNFELKNPAFFHYLTKVKEGCSRQRSRSIMIGSSRKGSVNSCRKRRETGGLLLRKNQELLIYVV